MKSHQKPFFVLMVIVLLAGMIGSQSPKPVQAANPLRISQVYAGGGAANSSYTNDFIEIYNSGSGPVSLAGMSIQYTTATGDEIFGGSANQITELPDVTLVAGQYYLILGGGGSGGALLPTPDLIDASPIAMSHGQGKVALVNSSGSLGCNGGSSPCTPAQLALIVDLVGYGSANFFEGLSATSGLTVTTAALRLDGGCTDTDDNNADFISSTPTPRNSESSKHSCGTTEVIGSDLRISQVYGGGGNTGAPYTHDFVELFNSGSIPVSLAGMSVQYTSAAGTGNFGANTGQLTELPDVTINPGQYYLIQEAGAATGVPLPTPDHIDPTPINMSGTNGKVALVNSTTTLGCNGGSTPCSPEQLALIVDLVGFGNANFYEGAAAVPTLSNTTAALRKGNGCIDTDENSLDFDVLAPAPRNMATPGQTCGPTEIIPTDLFFSEYIEGSGNNKALEIYNGTGASVDLTDYQVLYYNNAGTSATITYPLAGTVADGDVFVLTTDQAAQTLMDAADVILAYPSVVHFNGDDVIALQKVSTSAMLDIIGQIGLDPGTYWGTPPNTTAEYTLTRMETICGGDTDGYDPFDPADEWIAFPQDDFSHIGAHETSCVPSTDIPPTVSATVPANDATNIAPDTDITITFSESVTVVDGWFTISCAASGAHTAVVNDANPIFTLDPANNFSASELCTVTVAAEHVSDQDETIDQMEEDYVFSFTIAEGCGGDFTPIYEIQGSGMSSPMVNQTVTTEGVVVGDFQTGGKNGFYIQDEDGDDDEATSDGVFIYYLTAPDVVIGDKVRVTGNVSEYNGTTQVTGSAMQICSSENVIEPTEVSLPVESVDDFEKYEGMLVTFPQNLIISEYFNYDRYGEIVLTSQRHMTPTAIVEPGAPAQAAAEAYLLDRITLDDGRTPQNLHPAIHPNGEEFTLENLFRGGGTLTGVTGIMDYMFNLYRIQPTQGAVYEDVNPRSAAPDIAEGDLTIASFNVLNYFVTLDGSGNRCGPSGNMECRGADNEEEFERQRAKIVAALHKINADVYGLMEIENDRPSGDDPVADLVEGLNEIQGAGTYAYIHTGAIGTDAIKQAILYKPASVTPVGDYKVLDSSVDSRFKDNANRPVLAQIFEDNASGEQFVVAVNHLKSKGTACDGDPDTGDGQGNCNKTRLAAAQAMVDWLVDPDVFGDVEKVLIIGDLNSYDKEDPIDAIKLGADDLAGTNDDYLDMLHEKQGDDAYGYVFDGQTGYLDYALANLALTGHIVDANLWHINADEPDIIDYDNSFKPADQAELLYAADLYRSSDHDPVIVTLDFSSPDMEAVTPERGVVYLAGGENFVLTVDAFDLNLYSLEVDHSFGPPGYEVGDELYLPEFTVYADAVNPWGSPEAKAGFDAAGMTISYDEDEQIWTIDFGAAITNTHFIPNGVTFYLVLHDMAGYTWGSMYEVKDENTFAYTLVRDNVPPELISVTPSHNSTILLGSGDTFSLTIEAEDDNLYELEIDHSMETTLPEFSVYASEADPYGGDGDLFIAQGVTVTYDDETQTWVIDFGETVSGLIADNGGITFYLVLRDKAGNQWGSMYQVDEYNTFKYIVSQDLAAPTIVSGVAIGAAGFDDVYMAEMTFTVPQGYTVETIEFTMSEPVTIVSPGIVYLEGNPYGTMAATGGVLTVTPYTGNDVAGIPGTFTFTIDAGTVVDLAGNPLETLTATMVVEPSPIFNITDFGPWGTIWPGAYNLGWGYVPLFDTATIESIEVGMLDADRKSIVTYTAEGDQIVWQRENDYITSAKLSSAPFYRVYNGNPIAEGADLDWTIIFGESFDAWSPGWGYVEVTDIYGTTVYREIEYKGTLGDLTAPEIDEAIAVGVDPFDDVTATDLTFTVPQGYTVEKIEITMNEVVTVVGGTEVTLAGIPYGSIEVDSSGLILTVTPYTGNEVASEIGTFVFSVPAGKIFDISGNPLVTLEVTLIVENIAPVAVDDTYTVVEDNVLTVGAASGVLANDTDFDPTVLTAVLVEDPANGDLTLNADGSFVYTPDANYFGTDTFSYKANDGHDDSNLATVTITVTYVKDQVVAVDDEYETDEDTTLTVAAPGVLENDTDVDLNNMLAGLVTNVEHGQLTLKSDGSFVYIPDADWYGEDSFVYQLVTYPAPESLWTDEATVTITVHPVNDAPVAQDQSVSTAEDTVLEITLVATDVEDDDLTYEIVDQPEHGAVTLVGNVATYTPDLDYNGLDSFTFVTNDDELNSELAVVDITVTPVNDAPVAQDQSVSTAEDTALEITLVAIDVEDDDLTYEIVDQPEHGAVTLVGNVATYTPDQDYNGPDSFTFKANDGELGSNVAAVSITVTPVNDAPVAFDQDVDAVAGTPIEITLVATDVDGDPLIYVIVDQPLHGTVVIEGNVATYTPDDSYSGTDSFTFKAKDGTADSNVATVSITVTKVTFYNYLPIIQKP